MRQACGDRTRTQERVLSALPEERPMTGSHGRRLRGPVGALVLNKRSFGADFSPFLQSEICTYTEGLASSFLSGITYTLRPHPYPASQLCAVNKEMQVVGTGAHRPKSGPCGLRHRPALPFSGCPILDGPFRWRVPQLLYLYSGDD